MEDEIGDLIVTNGWNQLFASIRRDSSISDHASVEASRPDNRPLNRYRDVYPYDHSRVVLHGHPQTDYINASLVKAPRANRSYILAQGPLPSTVGHFWLAVWQERSKAVLMLNRVMEKGQLKCHQYWPLEPGGDPMEFEDVGLKLEHLESKPGQHYTVRTLRLTKLSTSESRDILHFHYTTWPDFGVPACPDTFLEFLQAVRDSGSLDPEVAGPPVVHCSAGIGRSGTFCLVDTCLVLISKEGPSKVRIQDVLLDLRSYRMGLIQTPDQLKFSYMAIAAGAAMANDIDQALFEELKASTAPCPPAVPSDSDSDSDPPPLPQRSDSLKMEALLKEILQQTNDMHQQNRTNVDILSRQMCSNGDNREEEPRVNGDHSNNSSPTSEGKVEVTAMENKTETTNNASGTAAAANKCILSNHKIEERKKEMELRRRKKEEKKATTDARIQEMKRKARESENSRKTRSMLRDKLVPIAVGVGMCTIGALVYYYSST